VKGRRLIDIPVSTSRHEQIILKVEAGQAAFVPHECIEAFARSGGGGAGQNGGSVNILEMESRGDEAQQHAGRT
jgi:hypothetical protein